MPFRMTVRCIQDVEDIIDYEFYDKAYLQEALESSGASIYPQGNKRLAIIGDAALTLVISEFGFEDGGSIGKNL